MYTASPILTDLFRLVFGRFNKRCKHVSPIVPIMWEPEGPEVVSKPKICGCLSNGQYSFIMWKCLDNTAWWEHAFDSLQNLIRRRHHRRIAYHNNILYRCLPWHPKKATKVKFMLGPDNFGFATKKKKSFSCCRKHRITKSQTSSPKSFKKQCITIHAYRSMRALYKK